MISSFLLLNFRFTCNSSDIYWVARICSILQDRSRHLSWYLYFTCISKYTLLSYKDLLNLLKGKFVSCATKCTCNSKHILLNVVRIFLRVTLSIFFWVTRICSYLVNGSRPCPICRMCDTFTVITMLVTITGGQGVSNQGHHHCVNSDYTCWHTHGN